MLKIKQALYKPEIQVLHAMHSPHLKGFDAKCKQFFLLSINQLIHYSNKPFNSLCPVHQLFMLTMTNQLRCISIQIFRIHFFLFCNCFVEKQNDLFNWIKFRIDTYISICHQSLHISNVMISNLTANYINSSLVAHKNYKIKGFKFICKLFTFLLPIIFS